MVVVERDSIVSATYLFQARSAPGSMSFFNAAWSGPRMELRLLPLSPRDAATRARYPPATGCPIKRLRRNDA